MAKKSAEFRLRARLRVERGEEIALGPGKVELLEHIARTGSIAEAAKRMEMSYMRAWTLVKTMERCFRKPLLEATRGGRERGGTRLTETGEKALALYRQMEEQNQTAVKETWRKLRRLLTAQ